MKNKKILSQIFQKTLLNRETCFASQFTCNLIRFLFSQLQIPTVTYCKLAQLQRRHFQIDDDDEEHDGGVDDNDDEDDGGVNDDYDVDGFDDGDEDATYCKFHKRHFQISKFHHLQKYPHCQPI